MTEILAGAILIYIDISCSHPVFITTKKAVAVAPEKLLGWRLVTASIEVADCMFRSAVGFTWAYCPGLKFWSNYSDLTRPHPKWWLSKGNPLLSRKIEFNLNYDVNPDPFILTSLGRDLTPTRGNFEIREVSLESLRTAPFLAMGI